MKKRVLMLAAALTLCTSAIFAQGISGGIKAGLNFANQSWGDDNGVDLKSRTSFHAGLFATINAGKIGIQPELLYNSVGSEIDGDNFKLDYLTIPVMVRVNFAKVFNVHAGPQFGVLLKGKIEDVDVKDQLKGSDISIGAGVGLDLPMGIVASARYTFGLSDISDSPLTGTSIKNNVFQLSLGYKLFGK